MSRRNIPVYVPTYRDKIPHVRTLLRIALRFLEEFGGAGAAHYVDESVDMGDYGNALAVAESLSFYRDYKRRTVESVYLAEVEALIEERSRDDG